MVKKFAGEAEDVIISESSYNNHSDPKCKGKFVEEIEGAFHCPSCGAWEYR